MRAAERRVQSEHVYTRVQCTVHWDIAIDAEYNRISSIVENSIDEENNVDGGFSNLETHKNCYHLPWSAMYLVWPARELHIAINLALKTQSSQWIFFISFRIQADGIFGWAGGILFFAGQRNEGMNTLLFRSRLFNFQILVDTDWFLFGLIDSWRNTI